MANPVITLADDLKTTLAAETGYTFERRVAPYWERKQVSVGKWVVIPATKETEIKARAVDRTRIAIDVAYQQALPESTDSQPDPIENHPWFDANMAKIETVEALFRPGGNLREHLFALGFYFQSLENNPIYRPDLLQDYQIFTSVVRITFDGEI